MIFCFCSDIHGNGPAWKAFRREMEQWNPQHIIFGGDVMGYYYDAEEILDDIQGMGDKITCLLGNHDQMFLQYLQGERELPALISRYGSSYRMAAEQVSSRNIRFLKSLPVMLKMECDGLKMGFFHGGPADPLQMRIYPDADLRHEESLDGWDLLFCGHTHHKMVKTARGCTVINPGSLGQPRDGQDYSYVIVDTKERSCRFCTFRADCRDLICRIQTLETPDMAQKLTELLQRRRPAFDSTFVSF